MWYNTFTRMALIGLALPAQILAGDTLSTKGLSTCLFGSDIQVDTLSVTYTRSTKEVVFNLAGNSAKEQNVSASLTVYAYGNQIYKKEFDPCTSDSHIEQLCPVSAGPFHASGSQQIPDSFASQIPSIAFAVPDLDGQAKLELTSKSSGEEVSCVKSDLSNGRSMQVKGVSYAAAGVAAGALAISGVTAAGAVGHAGLASASPGFGVVMGWFHSMATNGMLSVNYPAVYRNFAKNFAFSTGLIPWGDMQNSIDNFRSTTGGNLTQNSYVFLRNSTLEYSDGSTSTAKVKRGVDFLAGASRFVARDSDSGNSTDSGDGFHHFVSGIEAWAEQLSVPQANVFMTVLLIFAIVVAAIAVGILLFKVILEIWAMYGTFPEKLTNFRKDYWGILSRTITNLVLILYSIWVLYCVYQLSSGDSWAAKVLAAITLTIFTLLLGFFVWRISTLAKKYKQSEGDASGLYENKENWRKYSLFYDNYKKDYWWIFVPMIGYMFVKGCILAAGNGHGLAQTSCQLIVEALMLVLLLWYRPYVAKSSQWINLTIQVVRVLSVACVLIFVEELGLSQTTKTVTGIVLIAIQSGLTGILAILIATNAIILCVRENPHARRRREAEKMNNMDLTPLDARESLLMEPAQRKEFAEMSNFNFTGPYEPYRDQVYPKSKSPTGSTDRLVDPPSYTDTVEDDHHRRSLSRGSSHSRDSHGSLDGRHPTKPGYAY